MILDHLILKRGTSTKCDSFDGSQGEIAYDTTNETIRVYTGSSSKQVVTKDKMPTNISAFTNDIQYATKAEVNSIAMTLDKVYPVGSIYINVSNDANPATLLGGGTWERLQDGRVLIGANSTYTAGSTGGEASHTITTAEMPSHSHAAATNTVEGHTHDRGTMEITGTSTGVYTGTDTANSPTGAFSYTSAIGINTGSGSTYNRGQVETFRASQGWEGNTGSSGGHGHTVDVLPTGSGAAMNNMQPYLAVYMWKRVA